MNPSALLYIAAGIALFGMGLFTVIAYPHLLRKMLGMNVMGVGVFMVFVAMGYRGPDQVPDPVPHALVITGIVVSVCATGLGLALITRIKAVTGRAVILPDTEDVA